MVLPAATPPTRSHRHPLECNKHIHTQCLAHERVHANVTHQPLKWMSDRSPRSAMKTNDTPRKLRRKYVARARRLCRNPASDTVATRRYTIEHSHSCHVPSCAPDVRGNTTTRSPRVHKRRARAHTPSAVGNMYASSSSSEDAPSRPVPAPEPAAATGVHLNPDRGRARACAQPPCTRSERAGPCGRSARGRARSRKRTPAEPGRVSAPEAVHSQRTTRALVTVDSRKAKRRFDFWAMPDCALVPGCLAGPSASCTPYLYTIRCTGRRTGARR